jgi:hypothetical protein
MKSIRPGKKTWLARNYNGCALRTKAVSNPEVFSSQCRYFPNSTTEAPISFDDMIFGRYSRQVSGQALGGVRLLNQAAHIALFPSPWTESNGHHR